MLSDGDRALSCPKCEAPMVRRIARRGKNASSVNGSEGCCQRTLTLLVTHRVL